MLRSKLDTDSKTYRHNLSAAAREKDALKRQLATTQRNLEDREKEVRANGRTHRQQQQLGVAPNTPTWGHNAPVRTTTLHAAAPCASQATQPAVPCKPHRQQPHVASLWTYSLGREP